MELFNLFKSFNRLRAANSLKLLKMFNLFKSLDDPARPDSFESYHPRMVFFDSNYLNVLNDSNNPNVLNKRSDTALLRIQP
jgi:hypothetical protein